MQPQKMMVGDAFNQIEDAESDQNGCRQQLARPLDVLFARGASEDAEADSHEHVSAGVEDAVPDDVGIQGSADGPPDSPRRSACDAIAGSDAARSRRKSRRAPARKTTPPERESHVWLPGDPSWFTPCESWDGNEPGMKRVPIRTSLQVPSRSKVGRGQGNHRDDEYR